MKGIVLAGGSGTRLYPVTQVVSKQLLPIYNKPLIFFPLSTLMLAGIREVLLITTPTDQPLFRRCWRRFALGHFHPYAAQPSPEGWRRPSDRSRLHRRSALRLILGDNIFYGHGLIEILTQATALTSGARVFAYWVSDPERYGVVDFDGEGRACRVVEKPKNPVSNWAVTGLYFYDNRVVDIAADLKPSARGELEITDVNAAYLADGALDVVKLGRGFAWLDTGTHESLLHATQFVHSVQSRQGLQVACLEEIAFRKGFIDAEQLQRLADEGPACLSAYLRRVLSERDLRCPI
jgi:glucose-1-phosphate thymidylyltransferase